MSSTTNTTSTAGQVKEGISEIRQQDYQPNQGNAPAAVGADGSGTRAASGTDKSIEDPYFMNQEGHSVKQHTDNEHGMGAPHVGHKH